MYPAKLAIGSLPHSRVKLQNGYSYKQRHPASCPKSASVLAQNVLS